MSIRTKILLPLLAFLALGAVAAGLIGALSFADHGAMAGLAENSITAGEASRSARDQFEAAEQVIAQVVGMTDFVDQPTIERRFRAASTTIAVELARLKTAALSKDMEDLTQRTIARFGQWQADAEVVLGLRKAKEIPTTELMSRHSRDLRASLGRAVALAGGDARSQVAAAGEAIKGRFWLVCGVAGALAVVGGCGAFWLARNLAQPLRDLVGNARRLAAGDVSVQLVALERADEIGEIARAVEVFRENVRAQTDAQAEAANQRNVSAEERRRNEESRAAAAEAQAHVVQAIAGGLTRLAEGDLTARLSGFPEDYERLEEDFNAALERLCETMEIIVQNSTTIHSGTDEISHAADDLSRRTEQQAASLEETAAALDEITATVRKTAEGANHARSVVSTAKSDAERSGTVVRDAVAAMSEIEKSSGQISQIIGVIDEIAFQTNLLALNAGVEAARAGEAGRGFAVVASEVRALAQRSAQAAKEIKALIQASGTQVSSGVELVGETGKALDRIAAQVTEINGIVAEIAASAAEQSTGLAEVNTAVNQMDQVTQQNAAMVEQTTAASHSLAQEAEKLTSLVGQFRTGQERASSAPSRRSPAPVKPRAAVPRAAARPIARPMTRGNTALAMKAEAADDSWEEF
jgi:methyl-accepting chemotaxis protein